MTYELRPHDHDIKCGRGHGNNFHPGNRFYQERVEEKRQAYKEAAGNYDKNFIAASIIDAVEARSPPGRFLESKVVDGKEVWFEMGSRDKVIKKIKQALRDKQSKKSVSPPRSYIMPTTVTPNPTPSSTSPIFDNLPQQTFHHQQYASYSHNSNSDSYASMPLPTNHKHRATSSQLHESMPTLTSTPLPQEVQSNMFSASINFPPTNYEYAKMNGTTFIDESSKMTIDHKTDMSPHEHHPSMDAHVGGDKETFDYLRDSNNLQHLKDCIQDVEMHDGAFDLENDSRRESMRSSIDTQLLFSSLMRDSIKSIDTYRSVSNSGVDEGKRSSLTRDSLKSVDMQMLYSTLLE